MTATPATPDQNGLVPRQHISAGAVILAAHGDDIDIECVACDGKTRVVGALLNRTVCSSVMAAADRHVSTCTGSALATAIGVRRAA